MLNGKPQRPDVIDLPVQVGVRRLALSFMRDAEEARRRLKAADDSEALHDLRVALRRLRSTERAYRPYIEDSIKPRLRKRLRAIAHATGESRDLEVHIDLLADDFAEYDDCKAGVDYMQDVLQQRKKAADAAMFEAIRLEFDDVLQRLYTKLQRFTATVPPVGATVFRSTGDVCGELTTYALADLEARLASLKSVEQQDLAHSARISAKRLRYLAEPFIARLPVAGDVVDSLKALQDDLGKLHDLHVLLESVTCELSARDAQADGDTTASLEALKRRLHQERDRQFTNVRDAWLGDNSEALFTKSRALATELRSHGDEPVEIERKFLLTKMPKLRGRDVDVRHIEQGWLPGSVINERLRSERSRDGTHYYRTIKHGEGLRRTELEEEIDDRLFRSLWGLTKGRRVRKIRHKVKDDTGVEWEIDKFRDVKLVIAEIELPSDDTPVVSPDFLENVMVREVTGDAEYSNINLAR